MVSQLIPDINAVRTNLDDGLVCNLLQLGVPGVKPTLLDVRNCRYDEAWDVREPPDGLYAALPDATDADAYAHHRITPETMHGTH